jgi:hypothetical protein
MSKKRKKNNSSPEVYDHLFIEKREPLPRAFFYFTLAMLTLVTVFLGIILIKIL